MKSVRPLKEPLQYPICCRSSQSFLLSMIYIFRQEPDSSSDDVVKILHVGINAVMSSSKAPRDLLIASYLDW